MDINLNDSNILNVYRYGSHVYGTANEKSDEDFIVVTKDKVISNNINIHYYTIIEFQRLLDNHDVHVVECYFLPNEFKIKEEYKDFVFKLDLGKLRVSFSTVHNGSWIKGKKKLIVMSDYDKYLALKSLFHSIRILGNGIQIATHGKIINYGEYNWFLNDILKLGEEYERLELWEKFDAKYREFYNKLSTEFKKLCPKNLIPEHQVKEKLIKLFVDNGCYSDDVVKTHLISKIIKMFNEN